MIENIQISDYRSCTKTTFDLQPDLSVLIGPNGSGKTNVLNSCLLLRALTNEDIQYRNAIRRRGDIETANESTIKATFRLREKKLILTANMKIVTDETNSDAVVDSTQSWYAKDFTGNSKRPKIPLMFSRYFLNKNKFRNFSPYHFFLEGHNEEEVPDSLAKAISEVADFLHNIKYFGASQFTNPSLCPVSIEVEEEGDMRRGLGIRGIHNRFLYDLYGARNTDDYDEFFNVIGPNGIGLIDEIRFTKIQTSSVKLDVRSGGKVRQSTRNKLLVIPQFLIGKNELSPNQLSEGTFKTITLLFYLMTEESSALLIEEPEVCVHHGLLSSIVELIKRYSKEKQIIVSTHSDYVLDQIEPRHVFKVSRPKDIGTTVTQIQRGMSGDEIKALKDYLELEGNLGEYWRHGGFD